jgi:uncharacterized protein YecT (DUF1311 family)
MRLVYLILSFGITFLPLLASSQKAPDVVVLETQYQQCLDNGQNMLACSKLFYLQMDSLLNVYYQKLRTTCNDQQKSNLKTEQIKWLSKRDAYFKTTRYKAQKNSQNGIVPKDDEMFMYNDNAEFVQARVLELYKMRNTEYSTKK